MQHNIMGLMLSCDPRYRQSLCEELKQFDGEIQVSSIAPGVLLVDRLQGNEALWSAILTNTPMFLRHVFPVMHIISSETSPHDIAHKAATLLPKNLNGVKVAVQCRVLAEATNYRAVDVKDNVDHYITAHNGLTTVKDPELIVSVVVAAKVYIGFSRPEENLTHWNGGAVHYGSASNRFSRAQHKLEEALEILRIDISQCKSALDLGAAPGGWSKLLLDRGLKVTAVDTGELHPHLLKEPNLTYLRQNAFNIKLPKQGFDLFTCDMSWDPHRTAELLNSLHYLLSSKGKLIVTVKFMGNSPLGIVRSFIKQVGASYTLRRGRHLWHNREELTLYLEKK